MNKKHFDIEKHEEEILEDFEKGEFVSVDNLHEEKNIAKQAARNYIPVYGVGVCGQTRCAHYHSELDIIAIRFKCCQRFYACYQCHQAVAGHPAEPWQPGDYHTEAVLCGGCGGTVAIARYLACDYQCPHCKKPFNPACKNHYNLYFSIDQHADK